METFITNKILTDKNGEISGNYSTPSISAGGKLSSWHLELIIRAFPRIKVRDSLPNSWAVTSLSTSPLDLAKTAASCFTWAAAPECRPPRVSIAKGRKTRPVPSGYTNPTRYPTFFSIPDPTRFSFENYRVRVTRNIGYYPIFRVNPKKYPKYPEENQNTRKYPRINNVPGNTRSNI